MYRILIPLEWKLTVSWNSFGPGQICSKNVLCTSLDTVSVTVSPGSTVTFSNLPASLLQGWIDNPASNHGLLLLSTTDIDDQDIGFASRESKTPTGPELTFATVPKPCTLSGTRPPTTQPPAPLPSDSQLGTTWEHPPFGTLG